MARGFKIADAYVEITTDLDEVRRGASKIPGELGPEMDRSGKVLGQRLGKSLGDESTRQGRDAGSKLSQGIHLSIVRNSPLIAAAVGAALVAGAPLMLTAATGLFAGIGIVSAAQADKVQSAWLGTWNRVKAGAQEDARAIEPVLVGLADRVGDRFDKMRPQLRGIFEDVAPQIDVFAEGLLDLADNALPGFERAIERGMPVTMGFASFLEKTGTGLTDFLDRMTAHAPEAGEAFSGLGDTMGTLLPILGELLGQGAELATIVLPALNGTLGLTLSVLTALGPALPALITGFGALKIAQTAGGWVGGLVDKFNALDTGSGRIRGGFDKLAGVMTPVNVATGALAIGVGVVTAAIQASDDQVREWSAALREGGAAARIAGDEMSAQEAKIRDLSTGFKGAAVEVGGMSGILGIFKNDAEEARQATDEWLEALTPQARAAEEVKIATADLADKIELYGAASPEAAAAARDLTGAQEEQERANAELETAIHGVTEAMLAQADQALASIDSGFAYETALDNLEDSQRTLAEAIRDHGAASEEASDAERDFAEDLFSTARAAGQHAADMSGLKEGTAEYARVVQTQALAELYRLRDAFPQMAGPINEMIGRLEDAGVSLTELGQQHPMPTVSLNDIPLVGGVLASTDRLAGLGAQRPVPTVALNDGPFMGTYSSDLAAVYNLAAQRPTPMAGMNDGALRGAFNTTMGLLGTLAGQRPNPVAVLTALTGSAEAALNYAARNRSSTVFQSVVTSGSAKLWTGGKIGDAVRGFADGGSPSRRWDGRLVGPGGPFDDLIPAVTNMGEAIRVANSEWIINGPVSQSQGDRKMAALNSGQADIVMRDPRRRFADGGSPDGPPSVGAVRDVHFHLNGTVDFGDRRSLRRAAETLHAEFQQIERSLA